MQSQRIDFRETHAFRPVNTFSHLRLSEVRSLADVLEVLDALRRDEPGMHFLCTLDDLNQCCYTNMHASQHKHLSPRDADECVDFDDPKAVHAYEGVCLTHVQAQLDNPDLRQDWREVAGTLATTREDIEALVTMNRAPDEVLAHDEVVYVQRVPAQRDDLLIAGLPNGYFSCDWNVFQNHAVIRHLGAAYGYRFFGIGASWLGFVRDQMPDAALAQRLVADLAALYAPGDVDLADAVWTDLATVLGAQRLLLLGYTENYGE